MEFSKILKQERKKQNLTQTELAELLNVSDKTISSWENNRSYPDIVMLKQIADVLRINTNVLLDAEDFNPNIYNINKQTLEQNHEKEKKYIRKILISIFLNIVSLLIPIVHLILSSMYNLNKDQEQTLIPNYKEYEEVSKIVFPILIVISAIAIIISIAIFVIASVEYKNDLIETNNNVRYKTIFKKYTLIYIASFSITLFLAFSPMYENIYSVMISLLVLISIYLITNLFINKFLLIN